MRTRCGMGDSPLLFMGRGDVPARGGRSQTSGEVVHNRGVSAPPTSPAPLPDPHSNDPVIRVRLGPNGLPVGAAATARIDRPVATVWAAVADVEYFARHLPMVHRARRHGDQVTFELKFKI